MVLSSKTTYKTETPYPQPENIFAGHIFAVLDGAKPLSEPMLEYW